mgnify:CR=1 FL=1
MGNQCSIWFKAVIRGDVHSIKIGNKVNIGAVHSVSTSDESAQELIEKTADIIEKTGVKNDGVWMTTGILFAAIFT